MAAALASLHAHELERISGRLASHYEEAGLQAEALTCHLRAGDQALGDYASLSALHYFDRVVTLATSADQRVDGLYGRARAAFQLDRLQQALADVEAAQIVRTIADGLADDSLRATFVQAAPIRAILKGASHPP